VTRLSDEMIDRLRALPDERLGDRFEILGEAGAGGMGTVYRARDHETGGLVALKVLSAGGAIARFEEEALLLERLRHPAIVAYVAHGVTAAGEPFLAMEWLEGESLAERLARKPLAVDETIALAARVAGALAAAHEAGVVHRDIKPSNLFLPARAPAAATLIDFGVARRDDRDSELTKSGELLGTPAYMAPELARGGEGGDPRADLFSLGCVIFRCVANRPAFAGRDILAVLSELALHEPPRLGTIAEGVPPALGELVARLLAKSPLDRPGSAAEVKEALDAMVDEAVPSTLAGEAITPPSMGTPTRRSAPQLDEEIEEEEQEEERPPIPRLGRRPLYLLTGALVVAGYFLLRDKLGGPERGTIEPFTTPSAATRWTARAGEAGAERAVAVAVQGGAVYLALEESAAPRAPAELAADLPGLSPGGEDGVVMAFDAGGAPGWKRRFHGYRDVDMLSAATTAERVYAGGWFHRHIESDDGRRAESAGNDGLFLTTIDRASGRVERLGAYGEADLDLFLGKLALAGGEGGGLVVAGAYGGTLDLGCGKKQAEGPLDAFVASLAPDGACRFMLRFGDAGLQAFESVAVDQSQHITVAGELSGAAEIGASRHESRGGTDLLLARFAPDGALRWSRSIGNKSGLVGGVRVAAHPLGHILVAGWFEGELDFDGSAVAAEGTGHDLFVAKLDVAGVALWSRAIRVERPPCPVMACRLDRIGLAVDAEGGAVVALPFSGALELDATRLVARGTDVAVLRLDAHGEVKQAARYGDDAAQCEIPECVLSAAADRATVAIAGGFTGTLGHDLTASGEDAFVLALPP
jgi:hypothetical protein